MGSPGSASAARRGERSVFFSSVGWTETETYERSGLAAGDRIVGPAIVEEWSSTTIVPPGQVLTVDRFGNLIIREEESA